MDQVFFIARKDIIPPQRCTLNSSYRMAILGDKPNAASFDDGVPFGGAVGRMIWGTLSRTGVPQQSCYADNISPTSPFIIDDAHLARIKADLTEWRPNLVLLLGEAPLNLFLSGKNRIGDWRGSVFLADNFIPGQKCLATFHPSNVFINHADLPLLLFDSRRASDESTTPEFSHIPRQFRTEVSAADAVLNLQSLQRSHLTAVDLEGGVDGLRCISFSQDPSTGFIVPWDTFSLEEQCMVAPALAQVLGDPAIPKVLQNSLYDNFVLTHVYRMPIRGVVHDTMLSGWEIYCELPKSLAVQASIWTKEPFWKHQQGSPDRRTLWSYCCRDSAVTLEIQQAHKAALARSPDALAHYQFNVQLLAPLLYMQLRGIAYDAEGAAREHVETVREMAAYEGAIEETADGPVNLHSARQLCTVLYKKKGYPPQHPRKGRKVDLARWTADAEALAALQRLQPADRFIGDIIDWKRLDRLRAALLAQPDADGRMRTSYNVVGDEAGRVKTYASPTGTGADISLLSRDLFHADRGMLLFEVAWSDEREETDGEEATIEAHCRRLGSPAAWRQWVRDQLLSKGTLPCASGHTRTFFGRRDSNATLLEALSHEPAANLAFCINRALLALWLDPANRAHRDPDPDRPGPNHDDGRCGRAPALPGGAGGHHLSHLIVEPLHVWHGGLLCQGPADRAEWIGAKLREWCGQPLTIAGQSVLIPCVVSCGESWGKMVPCP